VIEYRWAENQFDRLSSLAAELVRRPVAVIVTSGGTAPALAAKAATATIPIVFTVPEDPVRLGLVASLARPGGNATGVNFLETAAGTMGLQIKVINASTSRDIDIAFSTFGRERPDALFVTGGPFLLSRRMQLALLAARHAIPTSYGSREYAEMGGLMTYGASLTDAHRQAGVYAGRILKGAKTIGSAGHAVDQIRAGYQPRGGQSPEPGSASGAARPRRRGDRMMARPCAKASIGISAREAPRAGPLLRIRRSGSPRQRTCGQGEARTCALSSLSCSVGIASEALPGGTWVCPAVSSFATPSLVR
jgi:ABC transporter substrate binding protein